MSRVLFKNARLKGDKVVKDLLVENGKFIKIAENITDKADEVYDLNSNLVVPPYVDPHIHLDYVYSIYDPTKGSTQDFESNLFSAIQMWSETKGGLSVEDYKRNARIAVKREMLHGTQYIRTHVDVTDPKLTALKAMFELKEELKDILTLQIIAFPQEGMYSYRNGKTTGADLVEEAVKMGADVVGAIPHFEFCREWGEKSVKKAVEIALKYDRLIDVHCDETDDPASKMLEILASLAWENGIGERTTASHTCAMGSYDNAYAFKLFKVLKASNMNFIACPTENIYLQGRYDQYPKRRGLTRIKEMYEQNINICFAQDSISDPWYPLGNGNLMTQLDFGIHLAHMMDVDKITDCIDLITLNGARTLNVLDTYGVEVGKDANFIVLDAKSEWEAVQERVGPLASIRGGKYLFKKETKVDFKNDLLSKLDK